MLINRCLFKYYIRRFEKEMCDFHMNKELMLFCIGKGNNMSLDRETREIIKISNIAEKPLFVPKSNKKKL